MRSKAKIIGEPSFSARGQVRITFEIEDKQTALQTYEELQNSDLDLEVKKHREKRSLDQNAYFHVLVNAIARKTHSSDDAVKKSLVLDYGVVMRDDGNKKVAVKIPASVEFATTIYPYARMYKETTEDGRNYKCYLLYKRTSEMETDEFNRLIDGTIEEAKTLGIQTDTPEEIERMKNLWKTAPSQ